MNRLLTLLHELRQRLESADHTDFRAVDYITEIEAVVKKPSSSQPLPEESKPNDPDDLTITKSTD